MTMDNNNNNNLIIFAGIIGNLRKVRRFQRRKNIFSDSSADHSWRLAVLAMAAAQEYGLKLDLDYAIKIALIHDIAESITGDIDAIRTYHNPGEQHKKNTAEKAAIKKIGSILPGSSGRNIKKIWTDYDAGQSQEARFIKALDKIEATMSILESTPKTILYPHIVATHMDDATTRFPSIIPLTSAVKQELKSLFRKNHIPWRKDYDKFLQ